MSPSDPRSSPLSPLGPCPTCGALCLLGVYDHNGSWRAFPGPRTPALGQPHHCVPAAQKGATQALLSRLGEARDAD
jgi:hypothetical protein